MGKGEKWILKLPKHQVMMLIEARPEIFTPMRTGTMLWAYVDVTKLNTDELRDYVTAAWRCIVTKKMIKEHFPDEARALVRPHTSTLRSDSKRSRVRDT